MLVNLIKIFTKSLCRKWWSIFHESWYSISQKIPWTYSDWPFLSAKIKNKKVEKLIANWHDKTEYVIHIRSLKQALNQGLLLKKVHIVSD